MIWGAVIIPVIAIVTLLLCFKSKVTTEEYLIQMGIPIILIIGMYFLGQHSSTAATEYLGGWVSYCVHEEAWNEYVHKTCSRTVSDSKGRTHTEYYNCSYVREHPERFYFVDSNDKEQSISYLDYDNFVRKFKNESKVGSHSGYSKSGSIYRTNFNNDISVMEPVTTAHTYTNKVKASHNVMNFPELSKKEVQESGVYDYSKYVNWHMPAIIGGGTSEDQRAFALLNARLGARKQIRVWVLMYNNISRSVVQDQINYWKNGNKNELVICIGLKNGILQWSDVFTWSDSDLFRIRVRDKLMEHFNEKPNLTSYAHWLEKEIETGWQRKSFKDFNYLNIDTPDWCVWMTYIVTLLSSIGLAIVNIKNDIRIDSVNQNHFRRFTSSWGRK